MNYCRLIFCTSSLKVSSRTTLWHGSMNICTMHMAKCGHSRSLRTLTIGVHLKWNWVFEYLQHLLIQYFCCPSISWPSTISRWSRLHAVDWWWFKGTDEGLYLPCLPYFFEEPTNSMSRFTWQLSWDMFLLQWFSVYPPSWRHVTLPAKTLYLPPCWTSSRSALINSMNFVIFSLCLVSVPQFRCLASMHWTTIIILFNFLVHPTDCVHLLQSRSISRLSRNPGGNLVITRLYRRC